MKTNLIRDLKSIEILTKMKKQNMSMKRLVNYQNKTN